MLPLYILTPMTGKEAAETRTVVIGTVELNWRLWVILIAASPVALVVTAAMWIVLGQTALLFLPIVEGAAAFLFYRRSASGLKLRTYRTILDRYNTLRSDQFYICGEPVDNGMTHFRNVVQASVVRSDASAGSVAPLVSSAPAPMPRRSRRDKSPSDGHSYTELPGMERMRAAASSASASAPAAHAAPVASDPFATARATASSEAIFGAPVPDHLDFATQQAAR